MFFYFLQLQAMHPGQDDRHVNEWKDRDQHQLLQALITEGIILLKLNNLSAASDR